MKCRPLGRREDKTASKPAKEPLLPASALRVKGSGVRMGNWKLEIGKMAVYMSFPVVLFYVFNQPKYFEEWTVRKRRELYPPLEKMHSQEIEECIRKLHEREEKKLLESLGGDLED